MPPSICVFRHNATYWMSDLPVEPESMPEGTELYVIPGESSSSYSIYTVIKQRPPDTKVSSDEQFLPHGTKVIEIYHSADGDASMAAAWQTLSKVAILNGIVPTPHT